MVCQQFSADDAHAAKDILCHVCQHAEGRTRAKILAALVATRPQAEAETIEEQLARLLLVLQRDGYLLEQRGAYAFRSFLLREYWHRRNHR